MRKVLNKNVTTERHLYQIEDSPPEPCKTF